MTMPVLPALDFSFLMCSERSGSNLAVHLLDSHPEVCAPSPTHLFRYLWENLFRYGDLDDERSWSTLVADAERLLAAKLGVWRRDLSAAEILRATTERTLPALFRAVYTAEADFQGKRHVFVKENSIYRFADELEKAFPDARYLYLFRDPRDMALSWKRAATMRGGVLRAAKVWRDDQRGFLRMARALGERVLNVRYEKLVADPQPTLRRICDHLGVRQSAAMTSFHTKVHTQRHAARFSDWSNLGREIIGDNFGGFVRGLSPLELRYVEALCAPEMTVLGYEPVSPETGRDVRALEALLQADEPWEKPAYLEVPEEERRRLARWRDAVDRLRQRQPPVELAR